MRDPEAMSFRRSLCVAAVLTVFSVVSIAPSADAQSSRGSGRGRTNSAPAAAPTPAPTPAPAREPEREARPAQRSAAPSRDEGWLKTPNRSGVFLEGGIMLVGADGRARPWFRGELGVPLGSSHLSLIVPVLFTNDHYGIFGDRVNLMTYGLFPGLRYEMPILNSHGDLSVWGEIGGGVLYSHLRRDVFGTTTTQRDNTFDGGFRIAPGATYTAAFGGMVTLQPFGLMMTFGQSGTKARFEMNLMIGYRWR